MSIDRRVEEYLATLSSSSWSGTVYRLMLGNAPPDRENTLGARWNPPGMPALYTSTSASLAIAEVKHNLGRQPRPIKSGLEKTLYTIDVAVHSMIDLTAALPELRRLGINEGSMFEDDMRVSQSIGRLITWFGHDALMVPSARSSGANLVIYPSRVEAELFVFEVRATSRITDL